MQDPNLLKEALLKYKKKNYHIQSWEEYLPELTNLINKVVKYTHENNLKVDAVVPILRGGAIPATFLAYKLNVLLVLPVQYKYFFVTGKVELRRIQGVNKKILRKENPTLLLVEGNHCYGNQAKYAARDLKEAFPGAEIIYAASNMDYNYQDVVDQASTTFFGNLTNACKELSDSECKKLGLQYKKELLFPWENVAEEWDIVQLRQTEYSNVEKLKNESSLVAEYQLT